LTADDMMNVNEPESEDTFSDKNVMIGKGPDGKIYVYDVTNNTILGTK